VVSVPNGAPATPQNGSSRRFEFLTNWRLTSNTSGKWTIATDDDGPGKILAHPTQQETDAGNNKRLTPETIAFAEHKRLPREFLLEQPRGTPWMTSQKNWAMAIENGVTGSDPCFAIPAGLFLSPSCISRRNTRQASNGERRKGKRLAHFEGGVGEGANVEVNVHQAQHQWRPAGRWRVRALAPGPDGALWAGTTRGLGYLRRPPRRTQRIVEAIGDIGEVTQAEQTVSVVAFDDTYPTPPWMFHYVWRVTEVGRLSDRSRPELRTKSPVYKAIFDHDGTYQLRVFALDRYGIWSEPRDLNFRVTLPKPNPVRDMLVKAATALGGAGVLYFALIFPLIPLYRHFSWVRTAINAVSSRNFLWRTKPSSTRAGHAAICSSSSRQAPMPCRCPSITSRNLCLQLGTGPGSR
jgi:hypothetical protein